MITSKVVNLQRPWSVSKAAFVWLAVVFLIAFIFFAITTEQNLPVMLPIMVTVSGTIFFAWILWLRQQTVPIFEIGTVYVAVVSVYTLYPLVSYLMNGLTYFPFNDNRLLNAQPTPPEIGVIGWHYVVHSVSFMGMYLIIRGRLPRPKIHFPTPDHTTLGVLVFFYLTIHLFFLLLDSAFNTSARTYLESYLAFGRLPFGIAQLASLLGGARFTITLAIFTVLFHNYVKYRLVIFAWLVWMTLTTVVHLEGRTEFILVLFSAIILYHFLVRPIPLWRVGLAGLAGLSFFIILGLMRMGWFFSESGTGYNIFSYANEFELIFGNAYDLRQLLSNGAIGQLPPGFHVPDLVIMIPRQLLPFEKITPAEWYVNTFYPIYAAQGGGLAFGTISESILGMGWLDLVARGAMLGFLLAQIHRYFTLRRSSFWMFVLNIWLMTQIYNCFRHTTFFPLYLFFYRFLWVALGVQGVCILLKGSIKGYHRSLLQYK